MSFSLDVWQAAEDDIADAAAWYAGRSGNLGTQFLDVVAESLSHVRVGPEAFPAVHGKVRRALLTRFPYALFFFVDDDFVRVVACMHVRRDPVRWQKRAR